MHTPLISMESTPKVHLLEENDIQYGSSKGCLRLFADSLQWESSSGTSLSLPLADIVGSSGSKEGDLRVYCWARMSATSGTRSRREYKFRSQNGTSSAWGIVVGMCSSGKEALCRDLAVSSLASASEEGDSPSVSFSFRASVRGVLSGLLFRPPPPPAPRSLLVYINPVAGAGNGKALFAELEPMLADAGCVCDVILLQSRGVPTREVSVMPASRLFAYEGILAVGGDGTLSEVVEGLMAREDWENAISSIRLSLIPAGSGNGLAVSLASAASLPFSHWTSGHAVAKGRVSNLDMASTFVKWSSPVATQDDQSGPGSESSPPPLWVNQPGVRQVTSPLSSSTLMPTPLTFPPADSGVGMITRRDGFWGTRKFSFLSLEWALAADIDIESESLRFLGNLRFDVYALIRVLWLRKYKGRFSYLPPPPSSSPPPVSPAPGSATGAGARPTTPVGALASPPSTSSGVPSSPHLPLLKHLVPFDHPVPPDWVTLEGTFTLLWAANTSHQSVGVSISPRGHHSSGQWTVILMRDAGMCAAARTLLALDLAGSAAETPGVEHFSCVAWRLEPEVNGEYGGEKVSGVHRAPGNVALDGESVAYGPVQGEIHPGLLKVYAHHP